MPIFNKAKPPKADARPAQVEPRKSTYTALSPRDAVPSIAADEDMLNKLTAEKIVTADSRHALQEILRGDDSLDIDPAVSKLLGEPPSDKAQKRKRIADLQIKEQTLEQAIALLNERLRIARPSAEKAILAAARPEAEKRISALADALKVVDAAHLELEDLLEAIEDQGVSWGSLGQIKPFFLGSHRDAGQRKIANYIGELKAAGYGV
ncbi:MAG: hypothetical protein EOR60_15050 [Mesorhizobium sp.]|nr:MAG: hypothetical protein EOR60_15050 [Mesorhizobium sp.]